MLKAVSEMLDFEVVTDSKIAATKVYCAKTMLDGIIKGLEPQESEGLRPNTLELRGTAAPGFPEPPVPPQPTEELAERFKYLPITSEGKLSEIKVQDAQRNTVTEAPENLKLKIDGKPTTYGKAKNKAFQEIEIL